jgi:predicted DNA-binding transcriptional regulator AlpA
MTVLVWRVCCWEPAEELLFTCDVLILKENILMKTEATLIHHINADDLIKLFTDLQNQINELKLHYEPKKPTELLTRNEVAELLKCDLSTIWLWCKKGKLVPYGIGNRIYFKRSEIELALINLGRS